MSASSSIHCRAFEELKKLYEKIKTCQMDRSMVDQFKDCDKSLINPKESSLGFPQCRSQVCMAKRFAPEVRPIECGVVTLSSMLENNSIVSRFNDKCSRAYKGKYDDQDVAVLVYAYCMSDPNQCPCGTLEDELLYTIGKMNDDPLAVPVLGYCWNQSARVLWIVSKFCEKIDDSIVRDIPTQNYLFAMSGVLKPDDDVVSAALSQHLACSEDDFLEQNASAPREEETSLVLDGVPVIVCSERQKAQPMKRQAPSCSPPSIPPLAKCQLLRCDKCYRSWGNPSFRQRYMEITAPPTFVFTCAFALPEIYEFWCNKGELCQFAPVMKREFFKTKCFCDKYWFVKHPGDFDKLLGFFRCEGDYISWNRFYLSVQYFGYWWLHFKPFEECWETLKNNFSHVSLDCVDKRLYYFRESSSSPGHLTAVFTPAKPGGMDGARLSFDTISRQFYYEGDYGVIFGATPLSALRNLFRIVQKSDLPIEALKRTTDPDDSVYGNGVKNKR